jgi:hypothetical protein
MSKHVDIACSNINFTINVRKGWGSNVWNHCSVNNEVWNLKDVLELKKSMSVKT